MKIAVFGANGRLGSRVVALARQRGYEVCSVDRHNVDTFDNPCDVAVDFSLPNATPMLVDYCLRHLVPLVVGTTGHSKQQLALLDSLKRHVVVVKKANFSKGIAAIAGAAKVISEQTNWSCAIVEAHRKGKADAPSGTARGLADEIGCKQILSLRLGNLEGTHSIVFAGVDECIEITHRATSVDIFALGALEIAEKIAKGKDFC